MKNTRVAVLRGGPSSEYDVSMITGAGVLSALSELGYFTKDIVVTKSGDWIIEGVVKSPDSALLAIDVVFIAMHGAYGEDGTVQKICERHHIPFTGSNSFPSNLAFNKDATKRSLRDSGVRLPKHVKVKREDYEHFTEIAAAILNEIGSEVVLKPTNSGSSHGVMMVGDDASLVKALEDMSVVYEEFMVEERIRGTEATVALLEDFRNQTHYLLPAIEIVPPQSSDFFDAEVKYNGATLELCPGRFSQAEKELLAEAALTVHRDLGLSQYSRSDFIVRNGEVYFLEVNTLPGLTPESLFPRAAAAVGCTFTQLIEHLILTARVNR